MIPSSICWLRCISIKHIKSIKNFYKQTKQKQNKKTYLVGRDDGLYKHKHKIRINKSHVINLKKKCSYLGVGDVTGPMQTFVDKSQ